MGNVKTKGSARVFENNFLELLTKTHPLIIIGMYIPICAGFMAYDVIEHQRPILHMIGLFLGGFFFWTFAEYFLHRFLYHWTNGTKWADRFHYMMHGVHHTYPNDKGRLFMPPIPSLFLAAIFFAMFWIPLREMAFSSWPGYVVGYLAYASIHYSIHAFKPKNSLFKAIATHHNLHHFKHPDKAFGVSSPIWDYVFGTLPPRENRGKVQSKA